MITPFQKCTMVPEKSCDQVSEPEPVPEKVCREQVVDQKCIEAVRDIPKEVCKNVPSHIQGVWSQWSGL